MVGLFGFVGKEDRLEAQEFLSQMARASEPENQFLVDLYRNHDFGIGRMHLGIINEAQQPIWNEDNTLCVMMEGEIYGYEDTKDMLVEKGHQFHLHNDAEYILHLYEEMGEHFVESLNGAFVAALWNEPERMLILVNDRLGSYPIYYAYRNGYLLYGSSVRALLADPDLSRDIDLLSVAQFLTLDHLLGNRTLLSNVSLLPPATILKFENGQYTSRQYWELKLTPEDPRTDLHNLIEQLNDHLRGAILRSVKGNIPTGLYLSGGFDSRTLLGFLCDTSLREELHTFTWGIPHSDDAHFALEAANKARVRHHYMQLAPDWLQKSGAEVVRITDGLGNIVNFHAFATLETVASQARVMYKGFFGDALMGFYSFPEFLGVYDQDTVTRLFLDRYSLTFNSIALKQLLNPNVHRQIEGLIFLSCRAALAEAGTPLAYDQLYYFDLLHRQRRLTLKGVELVRQRVLARTPFCDNQLVKFVLALPPGLRYGRYLAKAAFVAAHIDLAKIPFTPTRAPLVNCARDLSIRFSEMLNWHLKKIGIDFLPHARPHFSADYNGWMRAELRSWVEQILLDQNTLERGYFNPDYVRQLVRKQMDGENHAIRLGALISLELWHRQFID